MKVTTENFSIIEGVRIPSGSTLVVDKGYEGSVDMIGKRISKRVYDEYFKPKSKASGSKTIEE